MTTTRPMLSTFRGRMRWISRGKCYRYTRFLGEISPNTPTQITTTDMPMADYQCEACGFRFEHFFHRPPDTLVCEAEDPCPGTAERMASVPGEWQPRSAQAFEPVVVHRDRHGNVRFPGSANAKVPEGFMKVELRTSREVHAFER